VCLAVQINLLPFRKIRDTRDERNEDPNPIILDDHSFHLPFPSFDEVEMTSEKLICISMFLFLVFFSRLIEQLSIIPRGWKKKKRKRDRTTLRDFPRD